MLNGWLQTIVRARPSKMLFSNCCNRNKKLKLLVTRITTNRRKSLLFQAALWDNVDLLVDLLQEDHDIDCLDSWGRTPLHAAAISSNSKCLQVLINAGADINKQCGLRGENKTALHLCSELGYQSNVETLLSAQASFTLRDLNEMTAIDLARRNGHEDCVKSLQASVGEFNRLFLRSQFIRELKFIKRNTSDLITRKSCFTLICISFRDSWEPRKCRIVLLTSARVKTKKMAGNIFH